jgi:uncharacterized repeat protein (TIGR03806 family)
MDASDIKKFAAFVVPYEVNSPLWSDSADKTRGMVVPAGQKIHVKDCTAEPTACPYGPADSGKWVFPVGTVMLKSFAFDGKLVETRLFVHFDAKTWVGYGYQWNEAQTEATIVSEDGAMVSFNTGQRMVDWSYPSRLDCTTCHTKMGGDTLGPEMKQMNRMVGATNQLDAFEAKGMFDAPLTKPYPAAFVTPYAGQAGTPPASATIEERARTYLHSNCAYCHRPDGNFFYQDLRYGIALKDMSICGQDPLKGNAGVLDSQVLFPGKPEQSVLWLRMQSLVNRTRMPQVGTYHVDELGLALIGDWIKSISACPQ